jgi:hypothetical protein
LFVFVCRRIMSCLPCLCLFVGGSCLDCLVCVCLWIVVSSIQCVMLLLCFSTPPTNKHKQGNQDMNLLQTNTNKANKPWSSYKQTQTRQSRHDPPTNKHKQGKQDMILLQTNTNKAIKTWALLQTNTNKANKTLCLVCCLCLFVGGSCLDCLVCVCL